MKICKRGHQYEATKKQCPVCKADYERNWYIANSDRMKEKNLNWNLTNPDYQRNWYIANRDQVREDQHNYQLANRDQIRENQRENQRNYKRTRKATDPLFKLTHNIRSLIFHSFNNQGWSKSTKTQAILGCDFETFEAHLIKTAKANYGGKYFPKRPYHLDHIIPVSTATSELELIALNHYTNFQLLYPQHNLEKSDKLDWSIQAADHQPKGPLV